MPITRQFARLDGPEEMPALVFTRCDERAVSVWLEDGDGAAVGPRARAVVRFGGAWCPE